MRDGDLELTIHTFPCDTFRYISFIKAIQSKSFIVLAFSLEANGHGRVVDLGALVKDQRTGFWSGSGSS